MPGLKRKKIENCFADSMSYEYRLGIPNEELFEKLKPYGEVTRKEFRRPVLLFHAADGVQAKGVVGAEHMRVGYPEDHLETMEPFEQVLASLSAHPDEDA